MATANDKAVLNAIFNPLLPTAVEEEEEKRNDEKEGMEACLS